MYEHIPYPTLDASQKMTRAERVSSKPKTEVQRGILNSHRLMTFSFHLLNGVKNVLWNLVLPTNFSLIYALEKISTP